MDKETTLQLYPQRLIPKPENKKDINLSKEHLLCRWVPPSVPLRDIEGKLDVEAVLPDFDKTYPQIGDYSLNKLPASIVDDIYIEFVCEDKKKYAKTWNEGEDGLVPNNEDFHLNKNRTFFLFRIGDIDGFESSYTYPTKNPNPYKFRLFIIHVPTVSNFYHYEFGFKFYDLEGNVLSDNIPGKSHPARKLIAFEIRQRLVRIAKFSELECFQV